VQPPTTPHHRRHKSYASQAIRLGCCGNLVYLGCQLMLLVPISGTVDVGDSIAVGLGR
jgi:hypothetical protein